MTCQVRDPGSFLKLGLSISANHRADINFENE